ncbi:hypothetical protein V6C53_14160 [Desulfocurvibacter africanus]|uniref:Uncharacterized protein n=2 Tax=Desulfocurvibacter africanus TaxID=873 RepID=F3YVI0_DESAF|nr:hypothetical protein [Desulfocurvibacter africanus]EGJ48716.1 hypothetical protein Desaf_0360 [Desulfocurvibacter africanus subsp. africanus str. Walvis Bay]EMG36345.1 hypothetical protein PCS_02848 [Desulfocurvibacter africanus PCS]
MMATISELIENAMHSTTAGFVGVGLIFIYMAVIVGTALVRIYQNTQEEHH